jgi:ABC-type uncharacterized transport system involved in gliding motility auxiliary subunit
VLRGGHGWKGGQDHLGTVGGITLEQWAACLRNQHAILLFALVGRICEYVNMDLAQTRRVIAAGMIGNVLEWYDFAVYGYFATAIGREFFPNQNRVAQLLSAFGVFALGYLMRPAGGALH